MEMHQVRYFLATVSELNFTKAAERCNVTQPSLTRAIKQLEEELGGDLFRRERPQAQLTELGERMYPLLKQCYESALGARSLASAIKSGEIGSLKLALSRTINLELLTPSRRAQPAVQPVGRQAACAARRRRLSSCSKSGEAELAIAADVGEGWERLDRWPLFTEEFGLVSTPSIPCITLHHRVEELRQERWLRRAYCETSKQRRRSFAATTSTSIRATS